MAKSLSDLPLELLDQVAGELDHESLIHLALTNQLCMSVVYRKHLRGTFRISIGHPVTLEHNIKLWKTAFCESGLHTNFIPWTLQLEGCLTSTQKDGFDTVSERYACGARPTYSSRLYMRCSEEAEFVSSTFRGCAKPYYCKDQRSTSRERETLAEDQAWQSLGALISQIPNLNGVEFRCHNPFPKCVLDAIQKFHPECKVHVTLHDSTCYRESGYHLIEHVLTSPCLHGLTLKDGLFETSSPRRLKQCWQDLRHTLRAGTLKELVIDRCWHIEPSNEFVEEQPENVDSTVKHLARVKLRNLETLPRSRLESLIGLSVYSGLIDFSSLQTLNIGDRLTFQDVKWLTAMPRFKSLVNLRLAVAFDSGASESEYEEHIELLCLFLRELPPLQALDIHFDYWVAVDADIADCRSRMLRSALSTHGESLEKLRIGLDEVDEPECGVYWGDIDLGDVKRIRQSCPNLIDLCLQIKHSVGEPTEIAIYAQCGMIPSLQRLHVDLHTSTRLDLVPWPEHHNKVQYDAASGQDLYRFHPPEEVDPRWKQVGIYEADVTRHIANSAVDEKLARAIFKTIADHKHPGARPLLKLEIECCGPHIYCNYGSIYDSWHTVEYKYGDLEDSGMATVCGMISRDWVLSRKSTNDGGEKITAVGRPSLKYEQHDLYCDFPDYLKPVLRKIWPRIPKSFKNWQQKCHSFPLEKPDRKLLD